MVAARASNRRGITAVFSIAVTAVAVASSFAFLTGCAGGPQIKATTDELGLAVDPQFDGTIQIIEYAGSDIGDPIPWWIQVSVPEVESTDEYRHAYVFLHSIAEPSFEAIQERLATFPDSRRTTMAIHDRALSRFADTVGAGDVDGALVDETAQVILALEYAGFRRKADFWVHELLFDSEGTQVGERFRGWILVSVPRDQVNAGLRLAYQTANAHNPAENDSQVRAREQLLAGFRNGL